MEKEKYKVNIYVKPWVLEKLLSDEQWRRRLKNAHRKGKADKVLIAFCKKHGIPLHHDIVNGGRLTQT